MKNLANLWAIAYVQQKLGVEVEPVDEGSIITFMVPDTTEVHEAIKEFAAGGLVNASEYAECMKQLKRRVFQVKDNRGNNNIVRGSNYNGKRQDRQ